HRHQHRQRITEVEGEQQYDCHHHNFQNGGYDIEQTEAQQKADAVGTALDIPAQTPGAAAQMEVQVELVQMLEHPERHTAHGAFRHPCKDHIAQFIKEGGAVAQ